MAKKVAPRASIVSLERPRPEAERQFCLAAGDLGRKDSEPIPGRLLRGQFPRADNSPEPVEHWLIGPMPPPEKSPSTVEPAADDIFLPAEIIAAFVSSGKAWRDGPSWRLSKERRLWSLDARQREIGPESHLGRRSSFVIPAWAEKHAATDHTSTSDRQVCGWVAGQDQDGLIIVDVDGVVWADLGNLEPSISFH